MKFCLLFSLSPCTRYCLLIGSQLTTWSQGNLHYIGLHFFQLDREFFCLLPSLTRLYSAAASPSERLRLDGSLAKRERHEVRRKQKLKRIVLSWTQLDVFSSCRTHLDNHHFVSSISLQVVFALHTHCRPTCYFFFLLWYLMV